MDAHHTDDLSKARSELASDFRSLAAHAEELLQATTAASGDGIDRAREQLKDSLRRARSHVGDAQSYAAERGRAAVHATEGMVREHPWQALAAATLFGAVLGCIAGAGTVQHRKRH